MDLHGHIARRRREIEEALNRLMPKGDEYPPKIHEAMRYAVLSGGKRLRPMIVLESAELCRGGSYTEDAMIVACSIELIHSYSLVHDDLPCMDDDDLRHGKPTVHRVYGEAMAVLVGDALLTYAFQLLSTVNGEYLPRLLREFGSSCGSKGLIGGQVMDMEAEGQDPDPRVLRYIHLHKTGELMKLSARAGAIVGGGKEDEVEALGGFGENLGLAFQIVDDILDVIGDEASLGKRVRRDGERGKMTYPAIYGIEGARMKAREAVERAKEALRIFGDRAWVLIGISDMVLGRAFLGAGP
jgi:geranylgeranyl diphosphate synthase type II